MTRIMSPKVILPLLGSVIYICNLASGDEYTLYKYLLQEDIISSGRANVRPTEVHGETVEIGISFEMTKIISVEEKDQVMSSVGFFVAEWKAAHIGWKPDVFGGLEEIVLPPSQVWLPDIGLANSASDFYKSSYFKDFRVRVTHKGKVTWSFGGEIITMCSLDMTFYPFDLQTCEISLENWAYSGHEVNLRNATSNVTIVEYEPNGVWALVGTKAEHFEHYIEATNERIPEVRFSLLLQRKAMFYVLNLITPCALIIIVALAVYWLPADSGEKVSLGVTILLAFSVFQLVIADQTPVNSDYTPILARMVISIMSLSSISVLTSIWVLYLHHKDSARKVPPCIKSLCFRGIATILCMRVAVPVPDLVCREHSGSKGMDHACALEEELNGTNDRKPPKIESGDNSFNPALGKILENLTYITDRVKMKDEEDAIMAEWRAVARILDRFLFWLSVGVVLAIFIGLITQQDTEH